MTRLARSARRSRPSAEQADAARTRRRAHIAQAVGSLRSSEGFRAWRTAAKRFHRYSPHNLLLIAAQRPTPLGSRAADVARARLPRAPGRAGDPHPLPGPYRARDERTGEEERRVTFRNGYVFDRGQVEPIAGEAKPPAPPEPAPVEGDSHAALIPRLEAFARRELGFAVERRELHGAALGVCRSERRLIALERGQGPNAELAVLAHEVAHALGSATEATGASARSASPSARPTWRSPRRG